MFINWWKNVFSQPLPCRKVAVKFDLFFFQQICFYYYFFLIVFFYTKKLKFMSIHIFHFLRLNVAKYILKTIATLKLSIGQKINRIPPKPKIPFKIKNLKIQKHHFLRIAIVFDVMFFFVFFWYKIAFSEVFLVLAVKSMFLFSPFLFSKNCKRNRTIANLRYG